MDMQTNPSVSPLLLAFVAFSLIVETYRSLNKPAALAFAIISHLDLMILFWCLSKLYKAREEHGRREKNLKAAVWLSSTILIAMFAFRVAALTPVAVRVFLWVAAGLSISATFYACFLYHEESDTVQDSGRFMNESKYSMYP